MDLQQFLDIGISNKNTHNPNLYVVAHGNNPSVTIDTSKLHKKYHYNYKNYDTKVPSGIILVIFTPENTQQWGSPECLLPDLEAFRSEWHKTDHPFSKNAKIFLPGEKYINMCLKFETNRYFNIYDVNTGSPLTYKKIKNKTSRRCLKSDFPKNSQFTLEFLFDKLEDNRNKLVKNLQIVYLMACNPFPVTIDDEETEDIVMEHSYVTQLRSKLTQRGLDTFKSLTPKTKIPWTGSIRPGGNVSQINQTMLSMTNHPFFTLTANNIADQSQFNNKTEANHRKSALSVLTKLKSQKAKSKLNRLRGSTRKVITKKPSNRKFRRQLLSIKTK